MENKLILLKLFLDELGVPSSINTLDDRKKVQKAIYLGQLSGVDLGYRFGWYLMGPYSTALTRDYYSLAEDIESGDEGYQNKTLKKDIKCKIEKVKPLFNMPGNFPLAEEDWLELLSSFHFLKKVRKLSDEDAQKVLKEEKPRLVSFVDDAKSALTAVSIL